MGACFTSAEDTDATGCETLILFKATNSTPFADTGQELNVTLAQLSGVDATVQ